MKIGLLVTSLETGGAQAALPRIVKVMRDAGHTVELMACEPRGLGAGPWLEAAGIPYRLLLPRHRGKLVQIDACLRALRQSRPDVIWTLLSSAGMVGAATGWLLGIPVVSWKNCASRPLHSRLLRRATRLWIADSTSVEAYLTARAGIPRERIMTWTLFEQMHFDTWPQPWHAGTTLQIGSVGRLHPQKGYDLLIDAVGRLLRTQPALRNRFHVTLVGDGPQRAVLERAIAQRRLQSTFSLPGSVADVRAFLATLHLYVQPSRYEGMCLAAHEAMSAGLPIIASPVGELAVSVRTSGGGLLAEPDAAMLADALDRALRDPSALAALGAAGKAYIAATYGEAAFTAAGRAVLQRVETLVKRQPRRRTSAEVP